MKSIDKQFTLLFFTTLIFLILLNNFIDILFAPPYGWHTWRQTDGLSIALNYYNNPQLSFFQPAIHSYNESNHNGGVGEFPIIYYLVAQIWKVTGVQYWVFRFIMFTLSFYALYSFSKAIAHFTKNVHIGIFSILVLAGSPVYLAYVSSFIPNIAAFSLSLIGWAFFLNYLKNAKFYCFLISMLFFSFASLLKITEGINVAIIFFFLLVEKLNIYSFDATYFKHKLYIYFLAGLIVIIPVLAWYSFAKSYNLEQQSQYFSLRVWNAIWQENPEGPIKRAWDIMYNGTLWQLYSKKTIVIFTIIFVYALFKWKQLNKLLRLTVALSFAWSVFYFLVFYYTFVWHDYYLTGYLILPLFLVITVSEYLLRTYGKRPFLVMGMYLSLITLALFGSLAARLRFNNEDKLVKALRPLVRKRVIDTWNYENYQAQVFQRPFYTIEPYLRSLGIKRTDKVFVLFDYSPNISLALMNQYGYSNCFVNITDIESRLPNLQEQGLKYLLVIEHDGDEDVMERIQPFLHTKIGQHQNISIYKL